MFSHIVLSILGVPNFSLLCTTVVHEISRTYLCISTQTNNSEQISFVINRLSYQEDCIFGCADISGVPRNFVRWVGVQQIQLRTERTGIWGQQPPSQGFWR